MESLERLTLAEMQEFAANLRQVRCAPIDKGGGYEFMERVLKCQQYRRLSKGQKGVVRRFLRGTKLGDGGSHGIRTQRGRL